MSLALCRTHSHSDNGLAFNNFYINERLYAVRHYFSQPAFPRRPKKQLLQRASDAVVESIGAPLAAVRIMLHDLPETHYLNAGEFGTDALMFQVEFIEGRTEAQKAALIAALSRAGNDVTGVPESEVRVRLIDFPKPNMGMAGGISAQAMGR